MIKGLYIYHRDLRAGTEAPFSHQSSSLTWTTCVRSLVISDARLSLEECDVFTDEDALQFLTEIVCGLRSPMVGETEVQGQYKTMLERDGATISKDLLVLLKGVNFLARKVRQEHLQGLGAQSYGSYARKKLAEYGDIGLIGAGQLAVEIIPWLAKGRRTVHVFVRDPQRVPSQLRDSSNVQVKTLDQAQAWPEAIVLAAPMSAATFTDAVLIAHPKPKMILDLRSESRLDPLKPELHVVSLEEIFADIERAKAHSSQRVNAAKSLIRNSVKDLEAAVGRQLSSTKVS
jgi:glutamyl-tRNA reductase